jgi:hypothetical protein
MSNVQAQNTRFKQALANKEITQAQYDQAMAFQNAQSQPSYSPMPSDPSSTVVRQSGDSVWVSSKYNVSKVEESNTGTTYTLTSRASAPQTQGTPSLSERMLDVQTPPVLPSLGIGNPQAIFKSPLGSKPAPVRPLAPIAGIVASGESLVYFVPNILGVKGVPQAPPTLTGGLIGKGVQGAAGLVGYNATSTELETVMLNQRYGGAYAVGSVFGDVLTGVAIGKAVGYGVKTYKVLTPKINTVADKAASTVGWKIYDKGYRVIEPVYQKFNRVSSSIEAVDTSISKTYGATKFKVAEPIVSTGLKVKNEVSTFVSRASDLTFGGVKRVSPTAGNFGKGVVVPNITKPQKIVKPTLEFVNEKYFAQPIGKVRAGAKTVSTATNKAFDKSLAKEIVMYERNVGIPNVKASLTHYASPITSKRLIPKQPKQFALFGDQILEIKSLASAKNPLKITALKFPKNPLPQNIKALGKVTAGKTRYKLNLKTPEDKLLKSERTPLKFTAQIQQQEIKQATIQIEKTMMPQTTKAKASTSTMTSGGASRVVAGSYPGTQKQSFETEETQFLTMPNTSLKLDKPQMIFHNPIMGTQQNQRVTQLPKLSPQLSFLRQPTITRPTTSSMLTPLTTPMFNQRIDTKPLQISQLKPMQMPKLAQAQIAKMKIPMMPSLQLGGGFDNLGPKGNRSGQWFQKKHKIKTYTQMLQTFGVGKAAKPMRFVDKALSKPINKLDKKLIGKSIRRKRR